MKTFKLNLRDAITYLTLVLALAALTQSCSPAITEQNDPIPYSQRKVTVLENGSVSFINARTYSEHGLYAVGDTVWVNLSTHSVDDISDSTMLCVITDGAVFPRADADYYNK